MKAILFINGMFHTHGRRDSKQGAMAVLEGRILHIGSEEETLSCFPAGINPEKVDLESKYVFPGFIDSHLHLMSHGLSMRYISLNDVDSINELINRIKAKAETTDDGKWILGRGWDQDHFTEKRYPTKKDLDIAAGNRPVLLTRACGHISVISSKALEISGITKETTDPPGGAIDRDSYGEPTGVLRESAQRLAHSKVPQMAGQQMEDALKSAITHVLSKGITSVHTNEGQAGFPGTMELYKKCREQGLPLRVYWDMPYDFIEFIKDTPLRTGDGDDYFRIGALKMFADGSLGGRTAALETPYSDHQKNRGMLVISPEELNRRVLTGHAMGMQIAIHTIGDRAVRVGLEAISRATKTIGRKNPRHRLIHCQILSPSLISEMKRHEIIADVQPIFLSTDMRWAVARLGRDRMRSSYPWQTMLRAGIHVAGGSDCPVEPPDPLLGIYSAVTRKNLDGKPKRGFFPNEKLRLQDALKMFTYEGAYAAFQEDRLGTLEPGKLADFVVLSQDPYGVQADEIKDIHVLMTAVGGEIAYSKS